MELLQLKYFVKIAKSPTLTQAARELHVSQPSLSGMLRKLEEECGGKLFDKEGRGLKLNDRGKILLHHGEEILDSLTALEEELEAFNHNRASKLTIALQAASQLVFPIIQEFQRRHPQIQINIIQNKEGYAPGEDDIDLLITADYKKPSAGRILLKEELLLVVPEAHRLADYDQISIEELREEGFILLSKGKVLRRIIDQYGKKFRFDPKVILESDDIWMVKELIRSGFGISIIPTVSWSSVGGDGLRKLHIDSGQWIRYIYLQRRSAKSNEAADLFTEEIQKAFSEYE